jgi:cell fate (sporulation/competence/biofilm development) regulator YlbF (YheA/YmcA/DUF963 family)
VGPQSLQELQDLIAVHAFYVSELERHLGHSVPAPSEVKEARNEPQNIESSIAFLKLWLDLLDMAMTPPMIRDGLKRTQGIETAHALLRYFVTKASQRSSDRDKTDCVITYLFRTPTPEAPKPWPRPETLATYFYLSQAATAFQGELYRALGEAKPREMIPEHAHLLQEFEYFHQELEEFRHFDQIMDSAIVQRVRELKHSLGRSFYHPESMARIAVWNDVFGRRFDDLFHDATKQIKTFAENVQREGASIMSRVEGDITVKHLAEIETQQILIEDYQNAQDQFRKVSSYKKAVDNKRVAKPVYAPIPPRAAPVQVVRPPAPQPQIPPAAFTLQTTAEAVASMSAQPRANPIKPQPSEVLAVSPSQAVQNAVHEGKLHSAREMIKHHVRTASPKINHIVPIKNSKIILSPAEVEAFRVDFGGEKSFRSDYANLMMGLVSSLARMIVEVDEYNQKAGSAYLWKPHADALTHLLSILERLSMEAEQLKVVARGRGLQDKAVALDASLEKLRSYAQTVSVALQSANQSHTG